MSKHIATHNSEMKAPRRGDSPVIQMGSDSLADDSLNLVIKAGRNQKRDASESHALYADGPETPPEFEAQRAKKNNRKRSNQAHMQVQTS